MRGDSIRDFYAKTLALLGLGVLAGTGALVDYWPSGVALPVVGSTLSQPEIARSLPVPGGDPIAARLALRYRAPQPRPVVAAAKPIPRLPALALAAPSDGVLMQTAELSPPPPAIVPLATFAAASFDESYGEEISLSAPDYERTTTQALSAPSVALSEEDHDGLLTGAVKWTGTSILRTSRKTGASIVEVFRLVGGAVRKALPN